MKIEDYIARKREAELRKEGYKKYASVTIQHQHSRCFCDGQNLNCRVVTTEWRKKDEK